MDHLNRNLLKKTIVRIIVFAFGASCATLAVLLVVDAVVLNVHRDRSFNCRIEIDIFGRIVLFAILIYIAYKCGVCPLPQVKSWKLSPTSWTLWRSLPTPWKWWKIFALVCRRANMETTRLREFRERRIFQRRNKYVVTNLYIPVNDSEQGPSGLQNLPDTALATVPRSQPIDIQNAAVAEERFMKKYDDSVEKEQTTKTTRFYRTKYGSDYSSQTLQVEEMLKRTRLVRKGLAESRSLKSLREMLTQREPVEVSDDDVSNLSESLSAKCSIRRKPVEVKNSDDTGVIDPKESSPELIFRMS